MLTRTRVAGIAIGLVAAGSLAAGLIAVWNDPSATRAIAGLVIHPAPSKASRANADARPAVRGAANPLSRPTATSTAGGASRGQSGSGGQAQPAAPPPAAAAPSTAAPKPTATSTSPSYYTIINKAHTLDLNAMNNVNTAQVDVADSNGSWYQQWTGLKAGSAEKVVNRESGLCLNAKSVASGADVDIATCNGSANQLWVESGTRIYLKAASSDLCLAGDSSATNEEPAGVATCTSGTNQQWSP